MTHLWFISVVDEPQLMNYQGLGDFVTQQHPPIHHPLKTHHHAIVDELHPP
jgi:hypothetical protein